MVGSEKAAVISGCVGGLLLVVFLVAAYCFCLPSTLKRRLNRRRQPPEDPEKAATSMVNGGSVVVKSTSRGSVLINQDPESSYRNTTDLNGTPPENRNIPTRTSEPQAVHRESVRMESGRPPSRQNGDNEDLQGIKGFSMSIPDVTKVERTSRLVDDKHSLPQVAASQFYTLGRHTHSTNRSPQRGPNGHVYDPSEMSLYEHQQQQARYSVDAPQYFSIVRPHQKSASQEIYSDDDSNFLDQLLCDDRGTSPPPPAPANHVHTYTNMHRHSVALL